MFSRIAQDKDKFGGLPYIVDTNITVQQITMRSMAGLSIEVILKELPILDINDIHQALAFALHDMRQAVSYWKHDGMTPLTQVKGYSEILVGKTDFDDLSTIPEEQKQQWMSIIHTSSQRGIAHWQQLNHWLSATYSIISNEDNEVYQISRLLQAIEATAIAYEPTLDISIISRNNHENVELHSETATMFGSLIAFAKNTFKPSIIIEYEVTDTEIILSLLRELQYEDDDIQKLLTIPFNPIATVSRFCYVQGIQFVVEKHNNIVRYRAHLPLWTDTSESLE